MKSFQATTRANGILPPDSSTPLLTPNPTPSGAATSSTFFANDWGLKDLRDQCPKLTHVIDLTNTTRYYNAEKLKATCSSVLEHVKITTEGHVVPKNSVVRRFFDVVDGTLAKSPDALIGVHCTHGVNRTGYLICRYLVQRLSWAPKDAIKAFGLARGHDLERVNYLQDLQRSESRPWPTLTEGRHFVQRDSNARQFESSSNWFGNERQPAQRSIAHEVPRQERSNLSNLHYPPRPYHQQHHHHENQSHYQGQFRHQGQYYDQEERHHQEQYRNPGQYHHQDERHYWEENPHQTQRPFPSTNSRRGPRFAREPDYHTGPDYSSGAYFSSGYDHNWRSDDSARAECSSSYFAMGQVSSRRSNKTYLPKDQEGSMRSQSSRKSEYSRNKSYSRASGGSWRSDK
ncbi:RNA/RNP complex-1-interacting phosphatase-like isoform X3 [Tigriopus californicus]|nr:RNA/RNP complex-1-interacting phosphatase-like isoform X3 [Tigriopus californicus]